MKSSWALNIFGWTVDNDLFSIKSSSYNFSPGLKPVIKISISPLGLYLSFSCNLKV